MSYSYFFISPVSVVDSTIDRGAVVTALKVDRLPAGALSSHMVRARSTDITDACGSCTTATDVQVIKMFADLRDVYRNDQCYQYAEQRHLPGLITWVQQNGYTLVDMKHIDPNGIWLRR